MVTLFALSEQREQNTSADPVMLQGDAGAMMENRDEEHEHEHEHEHETLNADETKSNGSIIGVFRDFFLATFSDGYHRAYCCAEEGLFPGNPNSTYLKSAGAGDSTNPDTLTTGSIPSLPQSASCDSRKRRRKPLAVAVGFKYAEDINGRPIVVRPARRRTSSHSDTSPRAPPRQQLAETRDGSSPPLVLR